LSPCAASRRIHAARLVVLTLTCVTVRHLALHTLLYGMLAGGSIPRGPVVSLVSRFAKSGLPHPFGQAGLATSVWPSRFGLADLNLDLEPRFGAAKTDFKCEDPNRTPFGIDLSKI
jgi:hypothetical protein